jgi:hypothetical protein
MAAEKRKSQFSAVNWRSMDDSIGRFENPHNRLKHHLADRFGIHVSLILNSYVGYPLKQTIAKALKLAIRIARAFHGRDFLKKETDDGR